jgi:branched-chain amino acid transport system ATP-binding protein
MSDLLSLENVSKRFGGLTAVDGVSLAVRPGSITGLIGPNGAGKTTLFALISGFEQPSGGKIIFEERDMAHLAPHQHARCGIARTFQIVQPFHGLSVLDNIAIGARLRHRDRNAALAKATSISKLVGLADKLDAPAASLTVAGRKRLELARALAIEPKLLLLDEVLAGLNPSEIRDVLPIIRQIQASGVTILMIEHVMQAVMSVCETLYVLAEGRIIANGGPSEVVRDERVVEAYLGHGAAKRVAPLETIHG